MLPDATLIGVSGEDQNVTADTSCLELLNVNNTLVFDTGTDGSFLRGLQFFNVTSFANVTIYVGDVNSYKTVFIGEINQFEQTVTFYANGRYVALKTDSDFEFCYVQFPGKTAEAYSEPSQPSNIEVFMKTVNLLTTNVPNVRNKSVDLFSKWLKAFSYFR